MSWVNFGLTVIFLLAFVQETNGSGVLEIKFESYHNNEGDGSNGHCCDGKFFVCPSECDHMFTLCVDEAFGSDAMSDCSYGKYSTGEVANRDTIANFGSSIGGVPNYFPFKFTVWPGFFKIKVYIVDNDDNTDDHVETLIRTIRKQPSGYSKELISHRTILQLSVQVRCDPGYYTHSCAVYCIPQNDAINGFYTCEANTGRKICKAGWTGTICNEDINECYQSICENNGTCENIPATYTCSCLEDYKGINCEISPVCSSQPCLNGATCSEGFMFTYSCECAFGYSGERCETQDDPCTCSPCLNSGTCFSKLTTLEYNCSCSLDWLGSNCGIPMPPVTPITFNGEPTRIVLLGAIDDTNFPNLVEGLKNLAGDLGNIPKPILVQVETNVLEIAPNVNITEVDFVVAINDGKTIINNNDMDDIFKQNRPETINSYLPLTLYFSDAGIADQAAVSSMKPKPMRTWSSEYWWLYVLVVAIICVAAVFVFVYLFIRRRRSREDKNIVNNEYGVPPANMAFENVLYHDNNLANANQERKAPPIPTEPSLASTLSAETHLETENAVGGAAKPDSEYDMPRPLNLYQDIDDLKKHEPLPNGGAAAGPYLDMNGASPRSVDNPYQDFKNLAISLKTVSENEENHYQDLDKVKEDVELSDLSSDSEDEIDKQNASMSLA